MSLPRPAASSASRSRPHPASAPCRWLPLLLLAAGSLNAEDGQRFARAFPVEDVGEAPVFAIELTPEVYATLTRPDRSDLAVLDATGRRLAISLGSPPPVPPEAQRFALPLPQALAPSGTAPLGERLAVQVRDGGRRSVDVRIDAAPPAPAMQWLVDAGETGRGGIDALVFSVPESAGDFRLSLAVHGSDDLLRWQPLEPAAPLLRVGQGEGRIQRLEVTLPHSRYRHLALQPLGGATLPPIEALHALRHDPASPPRRLHLLDAVAGSEDGRRLQYPAPGPLPVVAVEPRLEERNAVNGFRLEQGQGAQAYPLLQGSAWRLELEEGPLYSGPFPAVLGGEGPLTLVFDAPARAPRLGLWYHPERLLVLASGAPPYRLLAGSGSERSRFEGTEEALAMLKAAQAPGWEPPLARLGPGVEAGGSAALAPPAPDTGGRWVLWAVLVLGAVAVAGASWRVLRQPPS